MNENDTRSAQKGERWRRFTFWCLVAAAGTLPFSHVPVQLALAVAIVGWIGWSIASRRARKVIDPFLWAASVYWTWNLVASAVSARPGHSLAAFFDNEWPATLGLLIWWTVATSNELRRLLQALFGSSGLAMSYGIVQTFTGIEWFNGAALHEVTGGLYRAVGFSGFYLTFAGFAMAVFFLATSYGLERPDRRLRWILPVLCILAILGTFARSVWLAMAIIVPLLALVAGKREWRKWLVFGAVGLVLVVVAFEPLRTRAVSITDLTQHQTRLNLWKTSMLMAADHPVFGIGQDNFTLAFETYRVEGFYDTFVHPHNDYLSVLVHGGFPALVAFLSMWLIILKRGWDAWRQGEGKNLCNWLGLGGTLALAGFLGSSMFQNYYGTFVNCFNWWLVTGVILSAYRTNVEVPQSSL